MKYSLLASDLDGTLLNDASEITDGVKKAVSLCVGNGGRFVIVSGRSRKSLRRFEEELGLIRPGCCGIGFNGGIVYDAHTREALLDNRLDNALAMEIIAALQKLTGNVVLYAGDRLFAEKNTPVNAAYSAHVRIPLEIAGLETITCPVSKILTKGEPDELTAIGLAMRQAVAGRAEMTRTSPRLLEFGDLRSRKGVGLEFLCARLGVPMGEVIAVGDSENDLSMIECAGLGAAVANAADEVKAAAKYAANSTNNEDVLLEIVERFMV
ncbi:MAG: HAD family hydrolase [Defluviitaleaceae bacterium]|nr:HAD family hydrolase [Defluviitaleaceae bacterium]